MISPLRAVQVTNVVLSALVFGGGQAGQLRQAWQAGDFVPYPQTVRTPQPLPPAPEYRDSLDLPFLQPAVTGQAQRRVSGDKDLLALAQAFHLATGCRIITMAALLSEIAAGEVAPEG